MVFFSGRVAAHLVRLSVFFRGDDNANKRRSAGSKITTGEPLKTLSPDFFGPSPYFITCSSPSMREETQRTPVSFSLLSFAFDGHPCKMLCEVAFTPVFFFFFFFALPFEALQKAFPRTVGRKSYVDGSARTIGQGARGVRASKIAVPQPNKCVRYWVAKVLP